MYLIPLALPAPFTSHRVTELRRRWFVVFAREITADLIVHKPDPKFGRVILEVHITTHPGILHREDAITFGATDNEAAADIHVLEEKAFSTQ